MSVRHENAPSNRLRLRLQARPNNSVIWEELRVELLLLFEQNQLRWFGYLFKKDFEYTVYSIRDLRADPDFTGRIFFPLWSENTMGAPRGAGESRWREGCLRFPPGPVASTTRPWVSGRCHLVGSSKGYGMNG